MPLKQRNTHQKSAVLEAVCELDHKHPTSYEVYECARKKHPAISQATVYRNLNMLVERGEVLRVEVSGAADRFDCNAEPHYHARCRVCDGVFDMGLAPHSALESSFVVPEGFQLEGHQLLATGVCAACSQN